MQSFTALWSDEVRAEGASRVTWEIEPVGELVPAAGHPRRAAADANNELYGGWPMILSGLKTLLETGELLDTPGLAALRAGLTQLSKPSPRRSSVRSQSPRRPPRRSAAASRLRVSSIAAQRSGSGGNGNGFERIARSRVASVSRPSSRSSATSAPKRLAPTPSPVWPTV